MSAAHRLVDLAKDHCEDKTYASLARRFGLTPQTIHMWKIGTAPLSPERVRELCKIAGENAEEWKILILAEQSKGEEKKTWEYVVKRLGIAAALVLFLGVATLPGPAAAGEKYFSEQPGQSMHYAKLSNG